jgi:hypothetical protein
MAIIGVRMSSAQGTSTGRKTGMVWVVNNGTVTLESHRNVGAANASSLALGRALLPAGTRSVARRYDVALNSRYLAV